MGGSGGGGVSGHKAFSFRPCLSSFIIQLPPVV